jgi:RimJ/RimL family protein N-acetyltransferase
MKLISQRLLFREILPTDTKDFVQISKDIAQNFSKTMLQDEKTYPKNLCQKYNIAPELNDEKTWFNPFENLSFPYLENAQKFVNNAIEKTNIVPRDNYILALEKIDEPNKLVGAIMFSSIPKAGRTHDLCGYFGFFIAPQFQGQGYITEAFSVVINFLYKELLPTLGFSNYDNIFMFATAHPLNIPSEKLQLKFGGKTNGEVFITPSGKFRKAYYFDPQITLNLDFIKNVQYKVQT